jgi:hypothetical protein
MSNDRFGLPDYADLDMLSAECFCQGVIPECFCRGVIPECFCRDVIPECFCRGATRPSVIPLDSRHKHAGMTPLMANEVTNESL